MSQEQGHQAGPEASVPARGEASAVEPSSHYQHGMGHDQAGSQGRSDRRRRGPKRRQKNAKAAFETPEVRRTQKAEMLLRARQIGRRRTGAEPSEIASPLEKSRLIVVANRLPISLVSDPESGELRSKKSSGGLVSALNGVHGLNMLWVGWPGRPITEEEAPDVERVCRDAGCIPVHLDAETVKLYYDGFANNVLWPLFHYIPLPIEDSADVERAQWEAYQRANQAFADKVCEIARDGDAIWFQDYHLMLAPQMLRSARPSLKIGWFLHTPFPSSEIYRSLSFREAILEGVLSADLVGFHTFDYGRHFLNSCTRILGLEYTPYGVESKGHLTRVGTFPIGIDPPKFLEELQQPRTQEQVSAFQSKFEGKRVVVGVDRLDMIKGIPQKLLAFEKFLTEHPEWRDSVVLVQVAVPSRITVPEYQRLRQHVHELVGRINGRFGTLSHVPIHYLDQSIPFHEMCALFRCSDLALITSVRDGMNLVSYEYIMCQKDKHGVLVLSEFAGAAQSLGAGALLVNPWNVRHTAATIHTALVMSEEERAERHRYLLRYVMEHTSQRWASAFLGELTDTHEEVLQTEAKKPPPLDLQGLRTSYNASRGRLIILGFQGTLTAADPYNHNQWALRSVRALPPFFVRPRSPARLRPCLTPSPAQHLARVRKCLADLAADPRNQVLIISASTRETLDSHFGELPVFLAAENGTFLRAGDRTQEWVCLETPDLSWMDPVADVFNYFSERTPGAVVERRETSVVFNFRNVELEYGRLQARDVLVHLFAGPLSIAPVDVMQGTKSLEVRHMGVTKGQMLLRVLMEVLSNPVSPVASHLTSQDIDFAFCACFCMDRDEDVFSMIHDLGGQRPVVLASPGLHAHTLSTTTATPGAGFAATEPRSSTAVDTASAERAHAADHRHHGGRSRTSTADMDSDTQASEDEAYLSVAAAMAGDRSLASKTRIEDFTGRSSMVLPRTQSAGQGKDTSPQAKQQQAGQGGTDRASNSVTGSGTGGGGAASQSPSLSGASSSGEMMFNHQPKLSLPSLKSESTFTCIITERPSQAQYHLADDKVVREVISILAADSVAHPAEAAPRAEAYDKSGSNVSLSDLGLR